MECCGVVCGNLQFRIRCAFNALKIMHKYILQEDSVTQRAMSDVMWGARYRDWLWFSRHRHRHTITDIAAAVDAVAETKSSSMQCLITVQADDFGRFNGEESKGVIYKKYEKRIFVCKWSFCHSMNQSQRRFVQNRGIKKQILSAWK